MRPAAQHPLDGQNPTVQVAAAQAGQFTPAGTGIGRKPHQQQILLGGEQRPRRPGAVQAGAYHVFGGGDLGLGGAQKLADLGEGVVASRYRPPWALHAGKWVARQKLFVDCPGHRRTQGKPAAGHRRHRQALLLPAPDRRPHISGRERGQSSPRQPVGQRRLDHMPV
ncbi:hypothetical protein [Pseudofrankia sp. BMG5.37]|uniref:hypothetical protein n=1 Tax=Pseudofrankia sp. BMG5.37 TaxID=3050035 RepID=UPI0028949D07|nr:hypothetical protein [Pseudofrankia sp. BMG5.37]MDT3442008.1 hypothetical protein [Pseudofrankia sp. BMG5.37]MDT3442544.1 hypothetical protein [Pseudofrankia sp. BMG5.37]MDT3446089.1 hypothetical protein [Pseudofrankia sp. BMG5.37]